MKHYTSLLLILDGLVKSPISAEFRKTASMISTGYESYSRDFRLFATPSYFGHIKTFINKTFQLIIINIFNLIIFFEIIIMITNKYI